MRPAEGEPTTKMRALARPPAWHGGCVPCELTDMREKERDARAYMGEALVNVILRCRSGVVQERETGVRWWEHNHGAMDGQGPQDVFIFSAMSWSISISYA